MSSADDVLLATLSEGASFCRRCRTLNVDLGRAVADFKQLARKAAFDTRDKDWTDLLSNAEANRTERRARAEEHLATPHEAPTARAAMPKRAPVEPAVDDRPTCPSCGTKVNQRDDGRITQHQSRNGVRCSRRYLAVNVTAPASRELRLKAESTGVNRLPAIGECHDCGKWLPGERRFCGQCLRKRA